MWCSFEEESTGKEKYSYYRDGVEGLSLYDTNSRDSGFDEQDDVKFLDEDSSLCEDSFLESFLNINFQKNAELPVDFNNVITKPLLKEQNVNVSPISNKKPHFRRSLSLQEETPKAKLCKRICENNGTKKARVLFGSPSNTENASPNTRKSLKRSISATEESIMCAVQKSSAQPDLIGDFSKELCLPLTKGKHQDLKSISPETLAKLLNGEYKDTVESFKIIDCRFPYEFDGGHIDGAINIYTRERCAELLNENQQVPENSEKRHILIFHCEFSAERGPNLYRHLRKEDRQKHASVYPYLRYPEMYLLEGGYKNFFEHFSTMCVPVAYKQMTHPGHAEEYRMFRQQSKSSNDSRKRQTNIKRLKI